MKYLKVLKKEYWFFKNLFSHATANRIPETWNFQDYNAYWEKRVKSNQVEISYPDILPYVLDKITVDDKILDIGCGTGMLLKTLQGQISNQSLGIDISEVAIGYAKKNGINAKHFNLFDDDFNTLGHFDYITCFEVIEHIQNSEYLLLLLLKHFPNSQIIFSIPNTGFIFSRLRLLIGRVPIQWVIHPGEHIRFWTKKDMDRTLKSLGFNILDCTPSRINSIFTRSFPGLFAESLIYHIELNKARSQR